MHDTPSDTTPITDPPPPRRGRWRRIAPDRPRAVLVAATFGIVSASGQAPFDLWPVALIALAGFAWVFDHATSTKQAAWIGWAAGTGYFAGALHWIVEPFLVDVARHGWMAPFAVVFLAGGLALFWGLALGVAHRMAPTGPMRLTMFVAALSGAEILRGLVMTGFPWASVGHVLIDSAFIHIAAWGGPNALTVLTLAFAAALSCVPARPMRAGVPLAVVGAGLIVTAPAFATRVPPTPADAPVLRLMQPNASQHEKWDPRLIPMFLDRMLAFSAQQPTADVVIWPETSVPSILDRADTLLNIIAQQAGGAISVVGIERRDDNGYYNSLVVVGPDGTAGDVYDKHHLVPFGEYLPLGALLSRLGLAPMVNRFGGFTAGSGPELVNLGDAGRALPLICYEAVFARDVAAAPERPDLLLQITNDAWFGTFSGPFQHLAQARLRAVEQGLPMVRVANTGVSAVIAADGEILGSIPLGQAGYLDLPKPPAAAQTLYARSGDWPIWLLVIAMFVVALVHGRFQLRMSGH